MWSSSLAWVALEDSALPNSFPKYKSGCVCWGALVLLGRQTEYSHVELLQPPKSRDGYPLKIWTELSSSIFDDPTFIEHLSSGGLGLSLAI